MPLRLSLRSRHLTGSPEVATHGRYVWQRMYGHWCLSSLAHDFFGDGPLYHIYACTNKQGLWLGLDPKSFWILTP